MLEHGGDIVRAAHEYGIPADRWLDLSTGINPLGYAVPAVAADAWRRLPSDPAPLLRAACGYYGTEDALPLAGTQAAIQALPRLRPRSRVLAADLTYVEYAHAWRRCGHSVCAVPPHEFETQLEDADVLIVCNPNNPTGERIASDRLLAWHGALAARGGWLIADEAFMDVTPDASLIPYAGRPGLIVLRSLGKFFGLAGARVGFAFAARDVLHVLADELGPWTVTGPSQAAACAALGDRGWQAEARATLSAAELRLRALLARSGVTTRGTALFQWWQDERAGELHGALARQAIWTRAFPEGGGVRFGLPGTAVQWQRLERALASWKQMQCA